MSFGRGHITPGNRRWNIEFRFSDPKPEKHPGRPFRFQPQCVLVFLTRRLFPYLKLESKVPRKLNKTNWLAAENQLHISSHGCSFPFAIEPLQIKQSNCVPFRNARRQERFLQLRGGQIDEANLTAELPGKDL